ncbi:MAG: hypothetical protein ACR2HJ_08310 [Fimbriimonadales bacterium]
MNNNRFAQSSLVWLILIVGAMTAVVTPILRSAAAGGSLCMSRNEAVAQAAMLYTQDNGDRLPPIMSDLSTSCEDSVYLAMLLLPYHGNWMNYRCPDDPDAVAALRIDACTGGTMRKRFDPITSSIKAHRGYNVQMLAPMVIVGGETFSAPILFSQVADPSNTILFVDSIWNRDPWGNPTGGGNYGVDAPCFKDANGNELRPFPEGTSSYYWFGGWNPDTPNAWNVHGGCWNWHGGFFVLVTLDGLAKSMTLRQLAAGCEVLQNSGGSAYDLSAYKWDIVE